MKRFKLTGLLLALTMVLAGCLPGLGTMAPLAVVVETPHIATVSFTPPAAAVDVIVNFEGGGINHVRPLDLQFACQEYRGGWDCFVHSQADPTQPRVIHPKDEPLIFVVTAIDSADVTAIVNWKPDQR